MFCPQCSEIDMIEIKPQYYTCPVCNTSVDASIYEYSSSTNG